MRFHRSSHQGFPGEGRQAISAGNGRRGRRGFSLVEILTTLAILSIMAAVSLPSIASLSQSGSLASGGNDVADLAVQAHDYALSHNVMTALVCVTTDPSVPDAQYRAFAVLAADSTGTNWTPVSRWLLLPATVSMSSSSADNTFLTHTGSSLSPTFSSLTYRGAPVTSYAYQVFYPDGHMDTSAASLKLRVQSAHNQANWYDLIFNPMTGTVKVNRP